MTPEFLVFVLTLVVGAVVAAGMLCIYEGARRIARWGSAGVGALLVGVGTVGAGGKAGAALFAAWGRRRQLEASPPTRSAEPRGGGEKAPLSPQERTAKSTETARL